MNSYRCDHVDGGGTGNGYDDGVVAITLVVAMMIVEVKCGSGDDGGFGGDSGCEVRRWW